VTSHWLTHYPARRRQKATEPMRAAQSDQTRPCCPGGLGGRSQCGAVFESPMSGPGTRNRPYRESLVTKLGVCGVGTVEDIRVRSASVSVPSS
jgi:hypothetical protein